MSACGILHAQPDVILEPDAQTMGLMEDLDPLPELNIYEDFNTVAGGEKVRQCNFKPCSGWVLDLYDNGQAKHRGLYAEGALVIYRNFYPDGTLERDLKQIDAIKTIMRTYHANGALRSETRYANGAVFKYQDHYSNGTLRYAEERHRTEPYFIRMDLYAPNGEPLSLLRLVDKKRIEFELKEFYPGGGLLSEGRARYDQRRMDTQKIGTWKHYLSDGTLDREELLVDGKVHGGR